MAIEIRPSGSEWAGKWVKMRNGFVFEVTRVLQDTGTEVFWLKDEHDILHRESEVIEWR